MADESRYLPRPANAASLLPSEARGLFRTNSYYGWTTGFCAGYLQTNVAAIPADLADDFEELCRKNHGPLPLLYRSKPGELGAPPLAENSDIRRDIPRYWVFSQGHLVEDTLDLSGFSWDDCVTFYLGCSFTFESGLRNAGVSIRGIDDVAVIKSGVRLSKAGRFDCNLVVSMRPIKKEQLATVVAVTAQFPDAHCIPTHIGDPARIGITDQSDVIAGPVEVMDGEAPVFWCCGLTVRAAIEAAEPKLAFTHRCGSMFITDVKYQCEPLSSDSPIVLALSREGDLFYASVVGESKSSLFSELEKIILDDPGQRGIEHLFQKDDLLKATLALSHADKVAITTGFPCLTDCEVKEETDGLPGALAICQALLALGKQVTLVSDDSNKALFESCVVHMAASFSSFSSVSVLSCQEAKALFSQSQNSSPPFDCLVAIERAGRASDGTYRTMKAVDITSFVNPVDDIFLEARSNPLVSTVAIGDGGNELGMGKVLEKVKEFIHEGRTIGCATPSDFLIAAGVSNWGGYAVSLGLLLVSSCPLHWLYRSRGIGARSPPDFKMKQFLPSPEQTTKLLEHMNSLGIRDGVNRGLDQSVDGIPLQVHLDKLNEIKAVAAATN